MRGKLTLAMMECNYNILQQNPISQSACAFVSLFQSVLVISFPIHMALQSEKASYFEQFVDQTGQKVMYGIFALALFLYLAILAIFVTLNLLTYFKKQVVLNQQKNTYKTLSKIVMSLFFANQTLFRLPIIILALMTITGFFFDKRPGEEIVVTCLAFNVLLLDLVLSLYNYFFLSLIFPLKQALFAMPQQTGFIQNEILYYSCAVFLSNKSKFSLETYIYGGTCIFSLINNLFLVRYYSEKLTLVTILNQTALLGSQLVVTMLSLLEGPSPAYIWVPMLFLIIALLFIGKVSYFYFRRESILAKDELQTQAEQYEWIWACSQVLLTEENQTVLKRKAASYSASEFKQKDFLLIRAQTMLCEHLSTCTSRTCPCHEEHVENIAHFYQDLDSSKTMSQKLKSVLFILIDIHLSHQPSNKKQNDEALRQQNSDIQMIKLFFYLILSDQMLNALHQTFVFHNCKHCGFQQCFQYQVLKISISDYHQECLQVREDRQERSEFVKYLIFENSFKDMLAIIERVTSSQEDYWNEVSKGTLDTQYQQRHSEYIVKKYEEFSVYKQIISQYCGDILFIEQLCYRFNSDAMNFEIESEDNLYKIQNIKATSKFVKRQQLKISSSAFDQSYSVLLISANPNSFQKIKLASKSIAALTGFTEDYLLKSYLTLLLPLAVDEVHFKSIKRFMRRDAQAQLNGVQLKNRWIRTKTNSMKNIDLDISFTISKDYDVDLIALIKEIDTKDFMNEQVSTQAIYSVLVNKLYRILHFSHNFASHFQLSEEVLKKGFQINQLIENLPEDLSEIENQELNYFYTMTLADIQKLNENFYGDHENQRYIIKLQFSSFSIEGVQLLVFEFVIINQEVSFSGILPGSNDNSLDINQMSLKVIPIADTQIANNSINLQKLQLRRLNEDEAEGTGDDEDFVRASVSSSNSSKNSNDLKQFIELSEIKSRECLEWEPIQGKRFKILLLVAMLLVLTLAGFNFGINKQIEKQYLIKLGSIQSEKLVKGAMGHQEMLLLSLLLLSNLPEDFDNSLLLQYKEDYPEVLQQMSRDVSKQLQEAIGNFSLEQKDWTEEFAYFVNQDEMEIISLTDYGQIMNQSLSFKNSLNLFLANSHMITNASLSLFELHWDFLAHSTLLDYSEAVKNAKEDQKSLISTLLFIFWNGSKKMSDQIFVIDEFYMEYIVQQKEIYTQWIKIFFIVSVIIVSLMCFAFIPFLINILNQYSVMLEMTQSLNKEDTNEIMDAIKQFQHFLQVKDYNKSILVKRRELGQTSSSYQTSHPYESTAYLKQTTQLTHNHSYLNSSQKMFLEQDKRKDIIIKKEHRSKKQKELGELYEEEKEEEDWGEEMEKVTVKDTVKGEIDGKTRMGTGEGDFGKGKGFGYQIRKQKTYVVIYMCVAAFLLSFYFGMIYQVQNSIIGYFQMGFEEMDTFFLNTPCIYFQYFLFLSNVLFNQSMTADSEYGQRFQNLSDICDDNEEMYRKIILEEDGMFQNIYYEMNQLDSDNHCNYTLAMNYSTFSICETALDGLLELGLSQAIKIMRSELQQSVVKYQHSLPWDRDLPFLQKLIFDEETINNILVTFFHTGPILYALEPKVVDDFERTIKSRSKELLVGFLVMTITMIVAELILQVIALGNIQRKLRAIKVVLKITPQKSLMKQKNILMKLNVNHLYNSN